MTEETCTAVLTPDRGVGNEEMRGRPGDDKYRRAPVGSFAVRAGSARERRAA